MTGSLSPTTPTVSAATHTFAYPQVVSIAPRAHTVLASSLPARAS